MSFVKLTNHCIEQAHKRYRFDEDTLLKMAEKAVMEGYSVNDAPSQQIKKYLLQKQKQGQKAYGYSSYVFIFSDDFVLITTFRLPYKYQKTL